MYVENELSRSWKWILGTVSALLLLPQLAMKELTTSEALYGLIARNANLTGNIFSITAQGQAVSAGHFYPWIVNVFGMFGVNEFTIRLPSIMGLAIMIFAAAFITYRYSGRQSAIVAGTCMLSTMAAVQMGARGEEDMLGAAFLTIAWVTWFEFSRSQKNWFKAWSVSLLLVSLSALCLGYYVFILFYIPLLCLRKPTDVRKRILHLPHFKSLALITTIHFIIYLFVINLSADSSSQIELGLSLGETDNYTSGLLSFPFTAAFYLLPWTFFSWPAYCAAFEPMEKDPVLFHFYRTVTLSMFITYWLIPDSSPLALLPVLVPLAIMTGLHYQILVRRYHIPIRKLIRFIFVCLVAVNSGLLFFFIIKQTGLVNVKAVERINLSADWILINIVISALAIALSVFLLLKGKFYPVWLKIICMVVMSHWCLITFRSLPDDGRYSMKKIGLALAKQIPENAQVLNRTRHANLGIMFYLNRSVVKFEGSYDTEKDNMPQVIYVVSNGERPVDIANDQSFYKWKEISKLLTGEKDVYQSWVGTRQTP